jgi:hypothetical protein
MALHKTIGKSLEHGAHALGVERVAALVAAAASLSLKLISR